MKSQSEVNRNAAFEEGLGSRNPFGVMDVPNPNDFEVARFAATTTPGGFADANAEPWGTANESDGTIEGNWSSRWNGGADPTIPEDAPYKWKRGSAQARSNRRARLSAVRLGSRRAQRADRCDAREPAKTGRKIYQFKQSCDHASLGRIDRERCKNRRTLDQRPPRLPQVASPSFRGAPFARTRIQNRTPLLDSGSAPKRRIPE